MNSYLAWNDGTFDGTATSAGGATPFPSDGGRSSPPLIVEVVGDDVTARRRARLDEMQRLVSRTCVQIIPLLGVALSAEGGQAFHRQRLVPLLEPAYEGTEQLLASWPVHQELDGRTAFTMTLGMHLGITLDAHMRGEQLEVERVSRVLADVVVRGLSRSAR